MYGKEMDCPSSLHGVQVLLLPVTTSFEDAEGLQRRVPQEAQSSAGASAPAR
jgi:hypothetical protein